MEAPTPAVTAAQDVPPELDALWILLLLFTWVELFLNFFELVTGWGPPAHVASTMLFSILALYGGHRQVVKARDPELAAALPKRKGERFVIIWGVFLLVARLAVTYVPPLDIGNHHIVLYFPHELLAITLEVIAVFTGTKISGTLLKPAGKIDAPTDNGGAAEGGGLGDAPPAPARNKSTYIPQAIALLRGGALPNDGAWYTIGEIIGRVRLLSPTPPGAKPQPPGWAVSDAVQALVSQGEIEKQAKKPRDPHTKYRWKQ